MDRSYAAAGAGAGAEFVAAEGVNAKLGDVAPDDREDEDWDCAAAAAAGVGGDVESSNYPGVNAAGWLHRGVQIEVLNR